MKTLISYGIWNKQDMIEWLLEGISECVPADHDVLFMFDNCIDNSIVNFENAITKYPNRKWFKKVFDSEVHEIHMHNEALNYLITYNYDCTVVFQDDMRLLSPLKFNYPTNRLGLVGGRDGYEFNHSEMCSSEWSESNQEDQVRYKPYKFIEKSFLNCGPIFYFNNTIKKVGFLDESFKHFYAWDDLCCRCLDIGLVNGLWTTDIEHRKFGRVLRSTYYDNDAGSLDRLLLAKKNPRYWAF